LKRYASSPAERLRRKRNIRSWDSRCGRRAPVGGHRSLLLLLPLSSGGCSCLVSMSWLLLLLLLLLKLMTSGPAVMFCLCSGAPAGAFHLLLLLPGLGGPSSGVTLEISASSCAAAAIAWLAPAVLYRLHSVEVTAACWLLPTQRRRLCVIVQQGGDVDPCLMVRMGWCIQLRCSAAAAPVMSAAGTRSAHMNFVHKFIARLWCVCVRFHGGSNSDGTATANTRCLYRLQSRDAQLGTRQARNYMHQWVVS
jgi:hypothetical protein